MALKGPLATSAGGGYRSPNIALREALDLYAGIRPCTAFPGVASAVPGTDLIVVRMNQEDLYAGIEYAAASVDGARLREFIAATDGRSLPDDTGLSVKTISTAAATRVARRAFEIASERDRSKVTAIHKATVMRETDGLFLDAARRVAAEHPQVAYEEQLVDAACHDLVARPQSFDVILAPMMYGDIVSDIAAALVGGLGMAPGVNVGEAARCSRLFTEPCRAARVATAPTRWRRCSAARCCCTNSESTRHASGCEPRSRRSSPRGCRHRTSAPATAIPLPRRPRGSRTQSSPRWAPRAASHRRRWRRG